MDGTIRRIIGYSFGKNSRFYDRTGLKTTVLGDGAFPKRSPNWGIRGFKIVNLYAQRSPNPNQVNPNDNWDLTNNPVTAKIRECQVDPECKAIVAAWGAIRPNDNAIIARKNQIANFINNIRTTSRTAANKRGYIGELTKEEYARHPKRNKKDGKFGQPRLIPDV